MVKKSIFITSFLFFIIPFSITAQDLMDLFADSTPQKNYTYATFKTTRIINSQSIENPAKGVLLFMISHHFGEMNQGAYEFWGLDQSTIRLGFEYGVTQRLALGVGRSSYHKNYDGFMKYKLIRQQTGSKNVPVSVSYFGSIACNGLKWEDPNRENYFSSRLSYTHQLFIARKFNDRISLQIAPTFIHANLVETTEDYNDQFAIGFGGRIKITKRISFNADYIYVIPEYATDGTYNSLAFGFDIETGGHVFQIHVTNSTGMYEKAFITETTSSWKDGGIRLGFNISRVFTVAK
jgi:hypothetical protein